MPDSVFRPANAMGGAPKQVAGGERADRNSTNRCSCDPRGGGRLPGEMPGVGSEGASVGSGGVGSGQALGPPNMCVSGLAF